MHRLLTVFIVLSLACITAGCGAKSNSGVAPDSSVQTANQGYYYDFNDILVPQEMSLESDRSFTIETPSSTAGVLVFEGKVERLSLTTFFINNMPKDNWIMRSAIKSNRSILIFEKAMRYAIITITDDMYTTECEVWVAPRTDGGGASLAPAPESYADPAVAVPEPEPGFIIEPPVPEQGLSE